MKKKQRTCANKYEFLHKSQRVQSIKWPKIYEKICERKKIYETRFHFNWVFANFNWIFTLIHCLSVALHFIYSTSFLPNMCVFQMDRWGSNDPYLSSACKWHNNILKPMNNSNLHKRIPERLYPLFPVFPHYHFLKIWRHSSCTKLPWWIHIFIRFWNRKSNICHIRTRRICETTLPGGSSESKSQGYKVVIHPSRQVIGKSIYPYHGRSC